VPRLLRNPGPAAPVQHLLGLGFMTSAFCHRYLLPIYYYLMLAADNISQTPPALNDHRLDILLRARKRAIH
jgi:hypothetical protein